MFNQYFYPDNHQNQNIGDAGLFEEVSQKMGRKIDDAKNEDDQTHGVVYLTVKLTFLYLRRLTLTL